MLHILTPGATVLGRLNLKGTSCSKSTGIEVKGTRVEKMGAKYGVLVFTFYVAIFTGAKCDIYTSIHKITALAEMEDNLFKEFEVFFQKSDTKGEIVPDSVIR